MPFFENAIELDTYLISDYPEVKSLADRLFQELIAVNPRRARTKTEEYRSKETLKIILINLIVAHDMAVAVRYPRRKSRYTGNSRYARLYFKYNRVIPIIDTLVDMGYVDTWKGYQNWEDQIRRESRMAASSKLIELFHDFNILTLDYIGVSPPGIEDLVQLRDDKGNDLSFDDDYKKKRDTMIEDLARYNEFISDHEVSFILQPETEVHALFLNRILKRLVNKGIVRITDFETDGFMRFEIDGETVHGYQINDDTYILMDGPGSEKAKKQIQSYHKVRISHYRKYYNTYTNNTLYQDTRTLTTNTTTNTTSNTLPITGTFFEISEQYQAVDTEITTTVKEELKKRPLSSFRIYHLSFVSLYQYLHRVFNTYPDNGGRFYGAWHINMPKAVRRCIVINGEPACELDYKAHHIRMLYHEVEIDYRDDPYEELCRDDLSQRAVYKIVSLVSINAETRQAAVNGIRKQLRDKGIPFDYTDKSIKACIEKFCEIHKPIVRFLNTGQWGYLQYKDSQITSHILIRMVKEGIPCLPIHDSYIVPLQHEDLLHEVMIEAYQKVMYGFSPVIEKEF